MEACSLNREPSPPNWHRRRYHAWVLVVSEPLIMRRLGVRHFVRDHSQRATNGTEIARRRTSCTGESRYDGRPLHADGGYSGTRALGYSVSRRVISMPPMVLAIRL